MLGNPLVSVLMTTYNRENYIGEAIKSVLASTYTNFELIIVDDYSVDTTVEIANRYASSDERIKVFVNEKNLGDYPNRNRAASYAAGKYIKYVDSDDLITSKGLEKMVFAMEQYREAAFGISQFIFDKDIAYPQLLTPEDSYRQHYNGFELFSYGPVGAIIKKEAFDSVGGFKATRYVSDTELWLKLSANFHVIKLEPALVVWREHPLQEYKLGKQDISYLRLTYPMDITFLSTSNCPLKNVEIEKIKNRLQWKHARDILSLAFKKGKMKLALLIYKESGLSFKQLLIGFKSYNLIKKSFSNINNFF